MLLFSLILLFISKNSYLCYENNNENKRQYIELNNYIMAKELKIRDLTLRDGQQSSFATRMTQAQIERCLPYY